MRESRAACPHLTLTRCLRTDTTLCHHRAGAAAWQGRAAKEALLKPVEDISHNNHEAYFGSWVADVRGSVAAWQRGSVAAWQRERCSVAQA